MTEKSFNCSCSCVCGLEEVCACARVGWSADLKMIKVQSDHTDVSSTLSKGPVTRSLSAEFIGVSRVSTTTNQNSSLSPPPLHLSLTTSHYLL